MSTVRSLLFVPAHREGWATKAAVSGADGILLDLEDSVPAESKILARRRAVDAVREISEEHPDLVVVVRPNDRSTPWFAEDMEGLTIAGVDAFLLPMLRGPADVAAYDAIVGFLEQRAGLTPGSVGLVPSLETAASLARCEELISASPRVLSLQAATARGADIERDVGFVWSAEGMESLYYRSRVVLACRAAGLDHPLCGVWQDIRDLDGLREFAAQNRRLGFRGQLILHPTHAPVVNDVFGLPAEERDRYRRMIAAFDTAVAQGIGAVMFEGEHIDAAHAATARKILDDDFSQEA